MKSIANKNENAMSSAKSDKITQESEKILTNPADMSARNVQHSGSGCCTAAGKQLLFMTHVRVICHAVKP